MTTFNYKYSFLIFITFLFSKTTFACSCSIPTIEEEYKRSYLVIKGRLIGIDTIVAANSMSYDRHGIRYGKHKYTPNFQTFVRAKFLVQKNFKSSTQLPDTIYVLTNAQLTACGYYFPPFFNQLSSFYDFIIYGDRWTDYSVEKIFKKQRNIKQIKKTPLHNVFFTNSCRLTNYANDTDLNRLEQFKT